MPGDVWRPIRQPLIRTPLFIKQASDQNNNHSGQLVTTSVTLQIFILCRGERQRQTFSPYSSGMSENLNRLLESWKSACCFYRDTAWRKELLSELIKYIEITIQDVWHNTKKQILGARFQIRKWWFKVEELTPYCRCFEHARPLGTEWDGGRAASLSSEGFLHPHSSALWLKSYAVNSCQSGAQVFV